MNRWVCLTDEEISFVRAVISPDILPESKFPEKKALLKKLEKSQTRIKISSGKDKGRALQQWVCARIGNLVGIEYNQQDDNCLIHSREMGQAGVDVILRGEAQQRFPFAIECKSTESMNMTAFIRQAQEYQKPGLDWLVVYRAKALKNPVVIMAWETLEKYVIARRG